MYFVHATQTLHCFNEALTDRVSPKHTHSAFPACFGVKGIIPQKNFYRLNLIFWIVMGCGLARFLSPWGHMLLYCLFRSVCCPSRSHIKSAPHALPFETPSTGICAAPRGLRCVAPQGPWGQTLRPKCSGGFRHLKSKRAIRHPITIQNVRFGQ